MDNVHLVSFATKGFWSYQDELVQSAQQFGIEKSFTYRESDLIGSPFYQAYKHIFNQKRGFGFWLWKPYFILEALKSVPDGDIIVYVDAAALFIESPDPLIQICKNNKAGMVVFDLWPLTNGEWTKRKTFEVMECDNPTYWNASQVVGGLLVLRKSAKVISFIEEWLSFCTNIDILAPDEHDTGKNLPGFQAHREDQSILAILVKKYDIETYRNPCRWGDFLKMPQFRNSNDYIGYPFNLKDTVNDYHIEFYMNSPYATIIEFNRKPNVHEPKITLFKKGLNKLFALGRILKHSLKKI
jgi:hypothetical protein